MYLISEFELCQFLLQILFWFNIFYITTQVHKTYKNTVWSCVVLTVDETEKKICIMLLSQKVKFLTCVIIVVARV